MFRCCCVFDGLISTQSDALFPVPSIFIQVIHSNLFQKIWKLFILTCLFEFGKFDWMINGWNVTTWSVGIGFYWFMYLIYIYLLIYLFIYLFIHSFIHSFILSFIYLYIHLFIYLIICLFVYLFNYLFNLIIHSLGWYAMLLYNICVNSSYNAPIFFYVTSRKLSKPINERSK